jgi:hypothetical protein
MTWTVGADPKRSRAFFSPWYIIIIKLIIFLYIYYIYF